MEKEIDYTNTLYLKQQDEELDRTLARIVSYLESMFNKNGFCPKNILLSQRDYDRIAKERPDIIHENRILGMNIEIKKEEQRYEKRGFRKGIRKI